MDRSRSGLKYNTVHASPDTAAAAIAHDIIGLTKQGISCGLGGIGSAMLQQTLLEALYLRLQGGGRQQVPLRPQFQHLHTTPLSTPNMIHEQQ